MNEESGWVVYIHPQARKEFEALPKKNRRAVDEGIQELRVTPYNVHVKKLVNGDGQFRVRVGEYRVFFEIEKKERAVYILQVKRRGSTTY